MTRRKADESPKLWELLLLPHGETKPAMKPTQKERPKMGTNFQYDHLVPAMPDDHTWALGYIP